MICSCVFVWLLIIDSRNIGIRSSGGKVAAARVAAAKLPESAGAAAKKTDDYLAVKVRAAADDAAETVSAIDKVCRGAAERSC